MTLRRDGHHRKTEAGAALTLGGEKGLEAALAGVLVHARADIAHLDPHAASAACAGTEGRGRDRDRAAVGHCVDGVEDEVGQGFAELGGIARCGRQAGFKLGRGRDDDAALLRHVAPPRARQLDDMRYQFVQIEGLRFDFSVVGSIEIP